MILCYSRVMMDEIVDNILEIAFFVTFLLREMIVVLKAFFVLFVVKNMCDNYVMLWHVPRRLTYDMFDSAFDFSSSTNLVCPQCWISLGLVTYFHKHWWCPQGKFIVGMVAIFPCLLSMCPIHDSEDLMGRLQKWFDTNNHQK